MSRSLKFWIRSGLVAVILIIILGYAYIETRDLLFGAKLVVEGISDGESYSQQILEIKGKAERTKRLTLNGRDLPVTKEGYFADQLILLPGYNIITISATDRFGKEKEKVYRVVRISN